MYLKCTINSTLFNHTLVSKRAGEVKNVKKKIQVVRKYELNYRLDVVFKYFSCFLVAADLLHTLSLQTVGDHQLKVPAIIE